MEQGEKIQLLQGLLQSPVWGQVIKPVLAAKIEQDMWLLATPIEHRKPPTPDSYLRARIHNLRMLKDDFVKAVQAYYVDLAERARQQEDEKRYASTVEFGRTAGQPGGGG